jgi:hypothetical protein
VQPLRRAARRLHQRGDQQGGEHDRQRLRLADEPSQQHDVT